MSLNVFKVVLLCGIVIFSSCKKKDSKEISTIQEHVQSGTWRVTQFIDSGEDEIYHFTGYTFTFSSSGTVTATKGVTIFSGTWSITKSSSDLDFNIHFNNNDDFDDLSDDWDIVSHSNKKIELVDVSGGNGDTDYLTFEKN